ncbi:MAG: helix-turn-helix transcriptional regulator [Symbiobacteriia bacterium]
MQNRIKELREAQGLTQDDLAKRLEVTRQTVLAIENDKYNPTLELAFKLARFFGQTIESIFSFREDEKK